MATPDPTAEQREKPRRISVPVHPVCWSQWKWQRVRARPPTISAFVRLLATASRIGRVD
jgi:hypothetical protein